MTSTASVVAHTYVPRTQEVLLKETNKKGGIFSEEVKLISHIKFKVQGQVIKMSFGFPLSMKVGKEKL